MKHTETTCQVGKIEGLSHRNDGVRSVLGEFGKEEGAFQLPQKSGQGSVLPQASWCVHRNGSVAYKRQCSCRFPVRVH